MKEPIRVEESIPHPDGSKEFRPGFRISITDGLVLISGTLAAWYLRHRIPWVSFAVLHVIGHFFLFCNVFRIARRLELAWAAVFLVCAFGAALTLFPPWPIGVGTSLLMTLLVLGLGIRHPSYHGIAWQRLNPQLRQWWLGAQADRRNGSKG